DVLHVAADERLRVAPAAHLVQPLSTLRTDHRVIADQEHPGVKERPAAAQLALDHRNTPRSEGGVSGAEEERTGSRESANRGAPVPHSLRVHRYHSPEYTSRPR